MPFPAPNDEPDTDAKKEYWKQLVTKAVELAKDQVANERSDARSDHTRSQTQRKTLDAEIAARRKAEWETDLEVHKQVLTAIVEVAKGSIERSRDSAKFVQTVSAALATGYTAVLGLVFAVKDNPLPARGFIPTIFLGLSAALATAYLAFLMQGAGGNAPPGAALPRENSMRKVDLLINWTGAAVYHRAPLLRGAVVALLLAVAFLPIAVITIENPPQIPVLMAAEPTPSAAQATPGVGPTSSAAAAVVPSAPVPSPSPSWPPPPTGAEDTALKAELYKAQLQVHVDALKESPAAAPASSKDSSRVESFSWSLAVLGVLVVAVISLVPFVWRRVRPKLQEQTPTSANPSSNTGSEQDRPKPRQGSTP